MSQPSRVATRIKLVCATFLLTAGSFGYNFDDHNSHIALASLEPTLINEAIAKKSGGRSGGGSFKRKPSRSTNKRQSSPSYNKKPSRSTNKRQSSPSYNKKPNRSTNERQSSPSYNREPSRTYRDEPSYQNRPRRARTYRNSPRSDSAATWLGIGFFVVILLCALLVIYLVFLALKSIFKNVKGQSQTNKVIRERDNDRVTVSMLQIALLAPDSLQQDLSILSTTTNTDSDSGLVSLMQESVLVLLRHETDWAYVRSKSNSLDIEQAESAFDRLSLAERSKFTGESLTNIDGNLQTKEAAQSSSDGLAQYVVVTLILGTADDRPLFTKINTEAELKEELLQLSSMRDDYLLRFELLWTPQTSGEYLTDEELLLEYSDIMPLA